MTSGNNASHAAHHSAAARSGRRHSHAALYAPGLSAAAADARAHAARPREAAPAGQGSVPYSRYHAATTCVVMPSWLVTREQRKAAKKAERKRSIVLVNADDLW